MSCEGDAVTWIEQLAPLPVVVPLLGAAVFSGAGRVLPRRVLDVTALLISAFVLVAAGLLAFHSVHHTIVYWFGNWNPDLNPASANHFPIGICFAIDPFGAGMAALVGLLAMAAFAFSWAYFEEVRSLYHTLMLLFVAAMCGLALTGDLFNLFVWFELMTASAVGLCGYKSEETWPLLGALNFAVVNTVGAFLSLAGIALLYAQTGSLNMAEVGRSLASHPPGSMFVLIAFTFCAAGFLVKLAAVPFQFWLADAHAVAPTPVCALFSGVMVELGLYAVARLHWLVFAPSLGTAGEDAVRSVFLIMGAATAVIGAIYCFGQRHLKRLLAFSTISHVGLMILGFGLLSPMAMSGTAIYIVGHGMTKGALFLCAGALLHRCGSVDEYDLRHAGRKPLLLWVLFLVGALALAGLPPFATFYGQSHIHVASKDLGFNWLSPVTILAEGLTAGAVMRFTARVFFGWGARQEATSRGSPHIPMDTETAGEHDHTPFWMWLPAAVLLALAAIVAVPNAYRTAAESAAIHFEQPQVLASVTLESAPDTHFSAPPSPAEFRLENVLTLAITLLAAGLALFPRVLGNRLNWLVGRGLIRAMRPLRLLQSGKVGDYIAWFAIGICAYGGLLIFWARSL
jgi:multicomponent Na+:H+ antiporter subunit D